MLYVFTTIKKIIKQKACEKDAGVNLRVLLMTILGQFLQPYDDDNGYNL